MADYIPNIPATSVLAVSVAFGPPPTLVEAKSSKVYSVNSFSKPTTALSVVSSKPIVEAG